MNVDMRSEFVSANVPLPSDDLSDLSEVETEVCAQDDGDELTGMGSSSMMPHEPSVDTEKVLIPQRGEERATSVPPPPFPSISLDLEGPESQPLLPGRATLLASNGTDSAIPRENTKGDADQEVGDDHEFDRPGTSTLFDVALAAEARLVHSEASVGDGAGRESHTENDDSEAYRQDIFIARLASYLDPQTVSVPEKSAREYSLLAATSPSDPAGSGASMGTSLAARTFVCPQLEPLFKSSGADVHVALRGVPSALAKYLGVAAIGSSSGILNILMPPPALGRG